MKKQLADNYVVPNSTSGSDEEEEEVEEEDVEQSIDGQSGTAFESTSTAALFSRLTKMSLQFAEMMEMHWKQQLAKKKSELTSHKVVLHAAHEGEARIYSWA